MDNRQEQNPIYVLGHAEDELQRLIKQSRLYDELTESVFLKAGISSGMRVLDLGCGAGDVSFLAAKLVGSAGEVIGIDKSPEAIATARRRAATAKLHNVTFIEADLATSRLNTQLTQWLAVLYCCFCRTLLQHSVE